MVYVPKLPNENPHPGIYNMICIRIPIVDPCVKNLGSRCVCSISVMALPWNSCSIRGQDDFNYPATRCMSPIRCQQLRIMFTVACAEKDIGACRGKCTESFHEWPRCGPLKMRGEESFMNFFMGHWPTLIKFEESEGRTLDLKIFER